MLSDLLDFISLTHEFHQVKRGIFATGEERYENDAEHSYQLALSCWYIIEENRLSLDRGKVMAYALVHDLVEVYAGDTWLYDSPDVLSTKHQREAAAAKKLKKKFPRFASLHTSIAEYEARENPESRFVYAVDKLLPVINIYLDNGRTWHVQNVSLDQLKATKTAKIATAPEIVPYYEELLNILESHQEYFPPVPATKVEEANH